MTELDLEALLKEKREEPNSVSISEVDSWLKGGIVFVGLFATLKWLFTKKMWLMFTSISSISIVTILAIVQFNSTPKTEIKSINQKESVIPSLKQEIKLEKAVVPEKSVNPNNGKGFMNEMYKMSFLGPLQLYTEQENNSIEPVVHKLPTIGIDNEPKDHFSRIDANGFVHFTLVNGKSCSIQNSIPSEEGQAPLDYSIKNGTLYLNSSNENNASDLIITVTDLEKIKLNGFCEMVTTSTFESSDLELDVNGETKGKLNLKSKNLDFESNGFSEVEIECDFEQSRIEINGFSKIKFIGTSVTTIMEVTGESKLSTEEFASQELLLKVSGENDKIETLVSSKLDVEISGKNTVVIIGSPEIVHQEVTEGSKLKIK